MKIPQTKRYSIYKKLVLQDKRSKKLNFEPDSREHYVYRITDHTRTEKEHYYGSHTPRKNKAYNSLIEEFWTYRTSSKYNVLNENKKEQYKIKILKVFNNPADKMIYEAFLHQYFNVKLSSKFWNESNQTPFGYDTTGISSWNKGISPSPSSTLKMANTRSNNNSYITGGEKTKAKLSKIEENGKTKATNRSIKAAKTMSESQKDGKTIREKAEEKRVNTLQHKIYHDKGIITKQQLQGIMVSKALSELVLFEGENMTKSQRRNIINSRLKIRKGKFYNIIKDDEIIFTGVSRKVINGIWNWFLNNIGKIAPKSRYERFQQYQGYKIIESDQINENILLESDNGLAVVIDHLSNHKT